MACANAQIVLRDDGLFADVEDVRVGHDFNRSLESVVWPQGIKSITFDECVYRRTSSTFNQSITNVAWPASLERLCLGYSFN